MATPPQPVGLGLIGCGQFGEYCLETYARLPGVRPAAAADANPSAARRVAERFGIPAVSDAESLIRRPDVDLVYIATPPATHYGLALHALAAGKHVLCEKPLATRLADADAILTAAAGSDLIAPVNFVLRHNVVALAVERIIRSGLLGLPLHASFENFAQDETLGPEHWFWDRQVSGGIFIEHGVHFFDLYRAWLGPCRILAAHAEKREGSEAQDRVMCIARHESGAVAYHYHGFDQASRMDRQLHRLEFELGDLAVHGWVPQSLTLTALVDEAGQARLGELLPGAATEVLERYDTPRGQGFRSRWTERRATGKVRMDWTPGHTKEALYRQCIGDLLADQLAYLADRSHVRLVTEQNGRAALALAVQATELAGG